MTALINLKASHVIYVDVKKRETRSDPNKDDLTEKYLLMKAELWKFLCNFIEQSPSPSHDGLRRVVIEPLSECWGLPQVI
jgi:hypothetical protein